MRNHLLTGLLFVFSVISLSSCATTPDAGATTAAVPYPLKTCVVMDGVALKPEGRPIRTVYQGQEMLFCCKQCLRIFQKDPEQYMSKFRQQTGG